MSPFGYVFRAAEARVRILGEKGEVEDEVRKASIRFKGNYSYSVTAGGPARPMKIDVDKFEPGRRLCGLKTINLNTGPLDPSLMREPLAYSAFRAAGVPAPRTAFARVRLTVQGLYDQRDLGWYVVVEQVDEEFLARHFGRSDGLLLKPEILRGMPYLGARWEKYADRYNAKGLITEPGARRFIQFMQLVHFADDVTFARRLGEFVEVNQFLRFLAVQALIANLDSLLTTGHNYYLYEDRGRYRFLPWDMNLSFGAFGAVASSAEQADLSIRRPHVPPNRLIERVLGTPALRQQYERVARELAEQVVTKERLETSIARMAGALGGPAAATRPREYPGVRELQGFITRRMESIAQQLAGKRAGFVPGESPSLWAEHRRQSLAMSAMMVLRAEGLVSKEPREGESAQVAEIRKRVAEWLAPRREGFSRAELAEALALVLPVPEHYVFDPGPGIDWAAVLFRAGDANRDGRLTPEEITAAAGAALGKADANGDGRVDAGEWMRALEAWAGASSTPGD